MSEIKPPLQILHHLDFKDLLRCGQMSKRIRSISMDESLWESVNLLFKKVPIGFLELVIKNGCKYLSLFGAKLIGETKDFNKFWKNIRELKRNKLVYLELMDCQVTENGDYGVVLESILDSCHSLQKLSLGRMSDNDVLPLNLSIFYRICLQNGKSLKVLNLPNCKGMDVKSLKMIVDHCKSLMEVDLTETELSEESIDFLCENLSIDIENLCFRGQNFYHEDNFRGLISRCTKLKTLDLNYTKPWTEYDTMPTLLTAYISDYLKDSLETIHLLPTDFMGMYMSKLTKIIFDLKSMSKLKVLYHNHPNNTHYIIRFLKQELPHLNMKNDGSKKSTKWLHNWIWDMKADQVLMFETYKSFAGLSFYYGPNIITFNDASDGEHKIIRWENPNR